MNFFIKKILTFVDNQKIDINKIGNYNLNQQEFADAIGITREMVGKMERGIEGCPAIKPFGTGFFAKRFRKVRKEAGLPTHFSIYGFKHTRIIHLKQDNATDADIMSLTGHKDFSAYAKYLRDLGLDADAGKISKISRVV